MRLGVRLRKFDDQGRECGDGECHFRQAQYFSAIGYCDVGTS